MVHHKITELDQRATRIWFNIREHVNSYIWFILTVDVELE